MTHKYVVEWQTGDYFDPSPATGTERPKWTNRDFKTLGEARKWARYIAKNNTPGVKLSKADLRKLPGGYLVWWHLNDSEEKFSESLPLRKRVQSK